MKILNSIPKDDGFFMPAEFEKHYGCIIIWPERQDSWPYGAVMARKAFSKVAREIAKSEKVTVIASNSSYDIAREALPYNIRVVEMSSNDSWARDYAPTFLKNKNGVIRGVDWYFNAWGGLYDGLYFPWDKDNSMARKICDLYDFDIYDARHFVLEGGSFHTDGQGTVITTEACLLSKGRNPNLSKKQIEDNLKNYLGAEKLIWLKHGIYNDETNEHIDNICAFVSPSEIVLSWCDDKNDPQYNMSKDCFDILSNSIDAKGRKFKIHKLPMPKPIFMTDYECEGLINFNGKPTRTVSDRLAASYVNFYISNDSIIMPSFNDENDIKAKKILQSVFKNKNVTQIYARDILIGGGNIHCITQQIPI